MKLKMQNRPVLAKFMIEYGEEIAEEFVDEILTELPENKVQDYINRLRNGHITPFAYYSTSSRRPLPICGCLYGTVSIYNMEDMLEEANEDVNRQLVELDVTTRFNVGVGDLTPLENILIDPRQDDKDYESETALQISRRRFLNALADVVEEYFAR